MSGLIEVPVTGGPKQNTAAVDPTVTDDVGSGYSVGSGWFNTVTRSRWVCYSASAGVAVWYRMNLDAFVGYKSGRFYGPHRSLLSSFALVADLPYACLIRIRERVTISQLGINVAVVGTATLAKVGLYDSSYGANGPVPNNKLSEMASPLAVNSVAAVSGALAANQTVDPGFYWIVSLFNGTITMVTVSSGDQTVSQETGGAALNDVLNTSAQMTGWTGVATYAGGLPAPFGTPTARLTHTPAAGFKIA